MIRHNKELFALLNKHGWEFSHSDQRVQGSYTITRAWFRKGPNCVLLSQALHNVQQEMLQHQAAKVADA